MVKSRLRVVGAFVIGAIVGSIVGGGIVSNARHPAATPTPVATAEAPQAAQPDLVATGTFIQPDINDPLRRGAGKVSVSADSVMLDSDFTVTPGPDYRVILVPKPAIRATGDVTNTMYVDLGPLSAFKGSQSYDVPAGVDLANYPSVVIWCRTYSALISSADLSFAKPGA